MVRGDFALKDAFNNKVILHLHCIISVDAKAGFYEVIFKKGREDESQSFHTHLISRNYPVRSTSILSGAEAVRVVDSCCIVEFSGLPPPPPPNPARLRRMSEAVLLAGLSRLYFNGMRVLL